MGDSSKTSSVVANLSELEKVALLSGQNIWHSRPIERLGVRSLFMADGPHGIRKQMGSADHLGINASQPSTCFPTAATIANSWNPALGERIGTALGQEAAHIGVDVLLGPGMNIKRSPLCGRNFEYFSEDPYLTGKMGAAYVRGIQSGGVAATPKHFAVNSQETRRMTSDSVLDQGTLREIYLTAFEIVVKEASPLTIMSSYNLINGVYANEHPQLLQNILRDEWGFDGTVVTDWGGGNDPVAAIAAGGTIEMPSPGFDSVGQIMNATNVDKAKLDARAAELIELGNRIKPVVTPDDIYESNHKLAQEAAEQSIVLLKNDNAILPLEANTKVAVIGQFAFTPRYQGAGSSLVNPTQIVTPIEALADCGLDVIATEPGFEFGAPSNADLLAKAKLAAQSADVALLYLGLDEIAESEGKDREHMDLPANQVELLAAVAAVNPNVVVVFAAGSAVEMPWIDHCKGLLHGYLGGQAGAPAMVRALTGAVNPSGRLSETYPLALSDTPTAGNFPSTVQHALYREGQFVGYRYYTTADVPVLFPFGFGLSYTSFAYSDLTVTADGITVTVTNTGSVAGADVPQLYVTPAAEARNLGPTPAFALKGFSKVSLEAGESTTVSIAFDEYTFRSFDAAHDQWITVAGSYQVAVGHNANERPLTASIEVNGQAAPQATAAAQIANYTAGRVKDVTDQEFAALLGHPIPATTSTSAPLGHNSPLSDMKYARSPLARAIYKHYLLRGLKKAEAKGVPNLNILFQYGMPFRAIAKMSGGMADMKMVDGILTLVNGKFFRGIGQVIKHFFGNRKRQKALQSEFTALSTGSSSSAKGK